MDALQLLLLDHARTHSRNVGEPEGGLAMGEFTFNTLDDGQMRRRPGDGLNSLVWLLWHMARTEDMAVNACIALRNQILQEGDWSARLGIDRIDMAAGMTDDEVGEFTMQVDIPALREYRDAVGRRSIEVIKKMSPDELDEPLDHSTIMSAFADGTISENAGWLEAFTKDKSKAFLLGHTLTAHNFMHIGEAFCLRSMIGERMPV